ncbi:MAG: RDD family protein [Treponema sp.]|jgi:uncharacterized RDD family membrane protein YckC|nr:RDD family protein [Treponema sp.]
MSGSLDTSLEMQTPEGIEYALFPAGIPVRACAWGIDFFLRGAALAALVITFAFLSNALGIWFFMILNFAINWFYYTVFEILWNGQTPGKRIMGIRVVEGGGAPVKPGASFLRNLLRFADGFFFLYLIAFISMAVSPGFRRLGDWAADTLVIYTAHTRLPGRFTPPALMREESVPWLADVPAIIPPKKLGFEEKQGLLMFARRYPLLGKERGDEIAHGWAARLREDSTDETQGLSSSQYLLGMAHTISGVP